MIYRSVFASKLDEVSLSSSINGAVALATVLLGRGLATRSPKRAKVRHDMQEIQMASCGGHGPRALEVVKKKWGPKRRSLPSQSFLSSDVGGIACVTGRRSLRAFVATLNVVMS